MKVSVVGLGKAGGALLASFHAASVPIAQRARRLDGLRRLGEVLFLAVPDDALADVDAALALRLKRTPDRSLPALVVHLAGARGIEALALVRQVVPVGTFHPLASLDGRSPIPPGTLIAVDAERPHHRRLLTDMARLIGARAAWVKSELRPLYHAGAVVSANLAVALLSAGIDLLVEAGVEKNLARASLARLLKSQAEHAISRPLSEALTGPVARGDAGTLARHLAALSGAPHRHVAALYRDLSLKLVDDVTKPPAATRRALATALGRPASRRGARNRA
jgi:predicted short-subunit dehydrogenase-like oxidoreductase (DUF2520 family)